MRRCASYRRAIVASIEGDLAPKDALRLASHLHDCTACRIVSARETRLASMLDDLGDPVEVDESFLQAVMASLPERASRPVSTTPARARLRRGLKLAGMAGLVTMTAALAARVLPSLHVDVATPAMPRFSPEETDGWLSLFGSAAQWVRVTAQSLAWTGSAEAMGPRTIGVLSLELALLGAACALGLSGALMLAARVTSRPS